MSKKQDRTKLQFFSESHIENLENEIQTVIKLYRNGRLSFQNALIRLHNAKDDIMTIYWHITTKINECQQTIKTISNYHKLKGPKPIPAPLPVVSSSDPVIHQLMQGFQDFQDGKIDFHQWEVIAIKCQQLLKSEGRSLQNEVKDILRKSKQFTKEQRDEIIRESQDLDNEVELKDMEIKKIKE